HRAADAPAAGPHAAAHVVDGASIHDIAVDHRALAADLDQALLVAVLPGELPLLVVAGPAAPAVHGLAEEPRRPPELVELGQRPQPLQEQQDGGNRLHEVVA